VQRVAARGRSIDVHAAEGETSDMGYLTFPRLFMLGLLACVAAGCGGETDASTGGGGTAAGGLPANGGAMAEGGALASGGRSSGGATTGGSVSSGGALPTGGAAVSGGMATGGRPGSGGMSTGGAVTGGVATGGAATGGRTSVPVCELVTALPAKGTGCATMGQSLCQADGGRCVCERGIWFCNTPCDATLPTPGSACDRGTVCANPSDVACNCNFGVWYCTHLSGCPVDHPLTGDACTGLEETFCAYPRGVTDSYDRTCFCSQGTGGSWLCRQLSCPAEQPSYDQNVPCGDYVYAICTYGSTVCECLGGGTWFCGLLIGPVFQQPSDGGE
jgi:hypothetical protein